MMRVSWVQILLPPSLSAVKDIIVTECVLTPPHQKRQKALLLSVAAPSLKIFTNPSPTAHTANTIPTTHTCGYSRHECMSWCTPANVTVKATDFKVSSRTFLWPPNDTIKISPFALAIKIKSLIINLDGIWLSAQKQLTLKHPLISKGTSPGGHRNQHQRALEFGIPRGVSTPLACGTVYWNLSQQKFES